MAVKDHPWPWLIGSLVLFTASMVFLYLYSHSPAGEAVRTEPTGATEQHQSGLTAAQAWDHIGDKETVRFHVGYTASDNEGDEFLDQLQDYTSGFVVVVFRENTSAFQVDPVQAFGGRTVDVTGTISEYKGHPQVIVSSPSQISLAPGG